MELDQLFLNIKDGCKYLEVAVMPDFLTIIQCQHNNNETWKCNKEDCPLLKGEENE